MLREIKIGSKVLVVNFLTGLILAVPNVLIWLLISYIDFKNASYSMFFMISLLIVMFGLTVLIWGFIAEKMWNWK